MTQTTSQVEAAVQQIMNFADVMADHESVATLLADESAPRAADYVAADGKYIAARKELESALRTALAGQQEVAAPVGTEKLAYVIAWLEGGCDPLQAAKELRSIVTPPVGAGGAGVMDARQDSFHSDSGECGRVQAPGPADAEHHGLDTAERVCFYEQDFYVLSNFSSFNVQWRGHNFMTSEHAYHWAKFHDHPDAINGAGHIEYQILRAPSAHAAFKIAEGCKSRRRPDWDAVKVGFMREILFAKVEQHEYVRRKLLATGTRELVENSWRDDYWGWGPNRDGKNMLGKLWMEVRTAILAKGGDQGEGK